MPALGGLKLYAVAFLFSFSFFLLSFFLFLKRKEENEKGKKECKGPETSNCLDKLAESRL